MELDPLFTGEGGLLTLRGEHSFISHFFSFLFLFFFFFHLSSVFGRFVALMKDNFYFDDDWEPRLPHVHDHDDPNHTHGPFSLSLPLPLSCLFSLSRHLFLLL